MVQKVQKVQNEYIKTMNKARNNGDESFVYKGSTYVKSSVASGMVIYVKEENLEEYLKNSKNSKKGKKGKKK